MQEYCSHAGLDYQIGCIKIAIIKCRLGQGVGLGDHTTWLLVTQYIICHKETTWDTLIETD